MDLAAPGGRNKFFHAKTASISDCSVSQFPSEEPDSAYFAADYFIDSYGCQVGLGETRDFLLVDDDVARHDAIDEPCVKVLESEAVLGVVFAKCRLA